MKHLSAALSMLAAASCGTAHIQAPSTAVVTATAETQPVGTANADAADDPAIWRDSANPERSLIVATDKKAGLYVYGLDGAPKHFVAAGQLNNVDLVDLGDRGLLVVASDRNDPANARLQVYRLDAAAARLEPLGSVTGGSGEAYGICLWNAPDGLYAFSVLKEGFVHQVRIGLGGSAPQGEILRTLRLARQPEGCVVDPRSGALYVGEERRGIWRFDVRPAASDEGALVAPVDRRQLVADVEGLALAPVADSGGYLIASSQGDNAFAVYELPGMRAVGRFRVAQGKFGSVEETDGIELALGSFGPAYPDGLLVVQDGHNQPNAQNFKLVSFGDVIAALELAR